MAYFQGELCLRGSIIPGGVNSMSAWDSLDESHCQQGGEFMNHLPLHLGVSDVRCWFFLLTRGNWVCTHLGWAFAYCEGMHFGLSILSFVLLSFHTGCVEPLPLSGGVGVFALFCLCMIVLSPASFLRGHVLVDRLRWAVTLVLGGRSYGFVLVRLKWSFLVFVWLLVI